MGVDSIMDLESPQGVGIETKTGSSSDLQGSSSDQQGWNRERRLGRTQKKEVTTKSKCGS